MIKPLFYTLVLCITCNLSAATFNSVSNGNYNVAARWTVVGADADGIPDSDDDVFLNNVVSLFAAGTARNITINPGAGLVLNSQPMQIYGSMTNNGTVAGATSSSVLFRLTGTLSGNPISAYMVYFYQDFTIAAGCGTSWCWSVVISPGRTVTNNGSIINYGMTNIYTGATLVNGSGSTLTTNGISSTGTFNGSAVPNTVTYSGNYTTVKGHSATYYHLTLNSSPAAVKTLSGSISVGGNLTINTGCTLNFNANSVFLGGNWINNANTNCQNMGQVIFVGAGTQTITRATSTTENFGSVVVAGSGTVLLGDSIFVNGSLTISAGTLDVSASNYSIGVRVTFSDNATFNARQGTVYMSGTVAQTITGISNTVFYNLTSFNSAGVTVSTFAKSISNILNVTTGAFGTGAGGTFTLLATGPTTAARIAPLGATASLTGTGWIIQTYINGPATAYWQYLSSPINGSTIADWDGDARFYMSAVGGNDGTACCPTFYSVRTYNTATNTYPNVTSTATALTAGRGFMVWMSDNMSGLASPLIYDSRGLPNFGTVNRAVTAGGAGGGYNLVGNPLACPVTYATVVSSSSATLSPNFLILQENGSYVTNPNGGTIAAGQGFMCIATASGNITFNESCKSTTANPNVIRMQAGNEIRIKVGNDVNGLGEEAVVKLNPGGDESMDLAVDLPYLVSPYDNATHIYTQNSYGEQFLLNNLGTEENHLMIPVNIVTSTPGGQTITFKDLNTVTEYNCAWLEDLTTGAKINLNEVDTYTFEEPGMDVTRNFILHLERTNDCTFDLQHATVSLDAQTNVFVSGEQIFAQFDFETEEVVTISMFDLSGRMVMGETTMNVSSQTVPLDNPDAHGIYLVRIQKGNEVSTKKIYY